MPEGDSLHALAATLAPVLEGREVLSFRARRVPDEAARSLAGRRIASVVARGKNLLVRFDDGRVLHVHLRMHGRVFVERPRSAFWTPARAAPDLRIVVAGASVAGVRLPVVRLLAREAEARDLATLGPDLVRVDWDRAEALRRMRALAGARPVGEALLDQRAVCGIGNVYKSEVLFLERIHPATPLRALDDRALSAVLARASVLLRQNLDGGPRRTRPSLGGARLWVYGRGGRACLRCGTAILRTQEARAGVAGRSTYHCARCQPAPTEVRR